MIVNSQFTADTFARTFATLYRKGKHPLVIYPAVNTNVPSNSFGLEDAQVDAKREIMFLSLNRFERKKNLNLALRAYAVYRKKTAATGSPQSRLVIAGGYDVRLKENVDHFNELKR